MIGTDAKIIGSNSYDETSNSDVVVITAGIARKPGMSRDDLLLTNMKIVGSVTEEIAKRSPNAILVIVSNPLDAMVQHAYKISGFPKERVVGMAGILDTARFRSFLAAELGGVPVSSLIKPDRLEEIVQRTRDGGAEIVSLLKTGSAYYAPSAASAQMVESILLDKKEILPCAAFLEGEYGINNLYAGVPIKLGASGVEEIIQVDLTEEESIALKNSADSVQELIEIMEKNA